MRIIFTKLEIILITIIEGDIIMKIKFNEAGIKKIADGMKKATTKYNLPTQPKKDTKDNKK